MKLLWIGISMIALGVIFGNPVPWYLFNHTEYHTLAQYIGLVSAYVFLGGFVVVIFSAGYYRAKALNDEDKIRTLRVGTNPPPTFKKPAPPPNPPKV